MSTGVSATGSLAAVGQANVGFPQGGQLTSVLVRVGDRVAPGQVLATIDDFPARQALATAQAQLDTAQANLDKIEDGTEVSGAQATLDQAQRILDATEDQVDAVAHADDTAVASAAPGPATIAAKQKRKLDRASGQLQIEMSRQGVVAAQNQLDAVTAARPHNVDAARAAVDGARAGVSTANRTLANTTLRAPSAGAVTALNGTVGEFVAPSSGTTATAPGDNAAIPGVAPITAGAAGAAGASGATAQQPGGSSFIVLQNPGLFQAVAPFEESDAVSIMPNQPASIAVDALPDRTLSGSVLAVAPSATAISTVVNYYVTVTLTQEDPRLRNGQTARVSVITGQAPNMLSVPNTAVRRQGDRSSVVVVTPDGRQILTPFTPGLVGPDRTQVLSGLTEGQQVLATGGQ